MFNSISPLNITKIVIQNFHQYFSIDSDRSIATFRLLTLPVLKSSTLCDLSFSTTNWHNFVRLSKRWIINIYCVIIANDKQSQVANRLVKIHFQIHSCKSQMSARINRLWYGRVWTDFTFLGQKIILHLPKYVGTKIHIPMRMTSSFNLTKPLGNCRLLCSC
jgi:hypothetical protein